MYNSIYIFFNFYKQNKKQYNLTKLVSFCTFCRKS